MDLDELDERGRDDAVAAGRAVVVAGPAAGEDFDLDLEELSTLARRHQPAQKRTVVVFLLSFGRV